MTTPIEQSFVSILDAKAKEAGYKSWNDLNAFPKYNSITRNNIITAAAEQYKEQGREGLFTLDEFKKYLVNQDSLGDIHYNLNEENIRKATLCEQCGKNKPIPNDTWCANCRSVD